MQSLMKNSLKFLALAAIAVLAAVSCQKNELRDSNSEDLFFSLRTSDTKTYMVSNPDGSFSPNWNNGDEIGVFFEDFASNKETPAGKLSNSNDSGATAKFEGTISSAGESGTIYAFYPASALGKTYANQSVGFDMPSIQHPTATSFDPAADILVAKPVDYIAEGGNVIVDDMQFARILAILKVELNSSFSAVQNQKVINFSIKSSAATLSGRPAVTLTASDGKITGWNVKNKEISAAYDKNSTVAVSGTDNNVYLTINPATIPVGEKLTFNIETEKYIITKEVTLSDEIKFTPGNLTEIKLSIAETNCEEKVIVDYSGEYLFVSGNYLMTGNAGEYFNLIKADGGTLQDFWKIEGVDDYVWTVAKTSAGNYTFYNAATDKYMALTKDDNKAYVVDDADDDTAKFTIKEEASALTVYNVAYPGRKMRCNSGANRFAFYSSTSTTGTVATLLAYTPDTRPTFSTVSGLVWDASGKTLSWNSVEGATNGYEYTTDDGVTVTAVDANTIDCSSWSNGDYSVKVRVVGTDAQKTSEWSEACEFTITGGAEAKYYTKVTEDLADWTGTYLIVSGTSAADGTITSKWLKCITVNVDAQDRILSDNKTDAVAVTIEETSPESGIYTIQFANGKYLGTTNANDGIKVAATAGDDFKWTFSFGEGLVKITNTIASGRHLRLNGTSGFRTYTGTTGTQATLYKLDEVAVTSITVSGTPIKTSYSAGEAFDTAGLTVTATYADASTKDVTNKVEWTVTPETLSAGTTSVKVVATYKGITSNEYVVNGLSVKALSSISVKTAPTKVVYTEGEKFDPAGLVIYRNYSDATKDEYAYNGNESDFTFDPTTSTALTTSVTSITITYSGKSVNQAITVNEKPALETMDAIFAAATTTEADAKVKFNNWVVSGVKGDNAYVTDGTKGLIIYQSSHGFEVGDILSGTVNCKLVKYNGSSELKGVKTTTTGLTVTKGGVITPATIAIADLTGVNTGAVITFESLKYDGSNFSDGTNTIKPYNTFITLPSLTSGRNYKVTGVYIQYKETKEIAPRSTEDIVLLSGPYLNASASKTSGIAAAGETVTITVDTNIEVWTVASDNAAFVVGAKSGNTVPVVISENTSTTNERTAKITVSATGVEDVVITLTQSKAGGGGTPKTVTYKQTSTSAASVSSGTAPTGSSVTFSNTYTVKDQLTKNNSMTYTLKGYAGKKITAISMSMHSNKSAGTGKFSLVAGTTTLAEIASNTGFNQSAWYGSWTQSYVAVTPTMTKTDYVIQTGEDVVLTISASANSLFCESITITYE